MGGITSRERMRAALCGEKTDRVPFFPCIYVDHACFAMRHGFEEAVADPRLGVRLMLEANVLYGSDAVRVFATPPRQWFAEKEVRRAGERLIQMDRRTGRVDGYFDVAGGGMLISAEPPEPVRTLEDAAAIVYPSADELLETGRLDAAREVTESAHEKGLFVVGMAGSQTVNFLVAQCDNPADALIMMLEEPELARKVFEIGTDASIEMGRAFARIGVDCLYIGDSYASGSVISPKLYEQYCVPAYRRAADAAHANGLLVYQHCCGNYNPHLELVKQEPLDGMEGLDPTSGMSVAHTKEVIGDALCLIGGVSCLSLLQATLEEVYAESRACIEAGGKDGRYVLGSACAVARFTPIENMRAFARAALDSE